MGQQIKRFFLKPLVLVLVTTLTPACVPYGSKASGKKRTDFSVNAPRTLDAGYGRALQDNPIILSGNNNLSASVSLGQFLESGQNFITTNSTLNENCTASGFTITDCYSVLNDINSTPINSVDSTWGYNPNQQKEAFLQINTFYHMRITLDKFFSALESSHTLGNTTLNLSYRTSLPGNLFSGSNFWYDSNNLIAYSACDDFANATFNPATFSMCFGIDPNNIGLYFSSDPTVIYHEMGHALVKVMLNFRNQAGALATTRRSNLGVRYYDEAGSINEGIADYFSFVMTQRTHFGEWALGRFYGASRPMSESDASHAPGVEESFEGRISYPDFLTYNTIDPGFLIEDVHNAGQITSHFLYAVTKELKNTCGHSHSVATNYVLGLIAETLSELGDLTGAGYSSYNTGTYNVNLLQDKGAGNTADDYVGYRWAHYINPINYRSFYQTFSRNFITLFNDSDNYGNTCNGNQITKDNFEVLLDSYGLLLFKSYNENGNGANNTVTAGNEWGHDPTLVPDPIGTVAPVNRIKSILISKDKIMLEPGQGKTDAFIFDKNSDILPLMRNLAFSGEIVQTSDLIPSTLPYNNGNGKISPGEILGVSLNLYNDSNTTMGGVQVLANSWDHAKYNTSSGEMEPCNNFEDAFPLCSEGAASINGCDATNTDAAGSSTVGDCHYISRENGTDASYPTNSDIKEPMTPVCFMLKRENNESKWVTQNAYRSDINLDTSQCLYQDGKFDTCFLNIIEGGDHAFYSKINAKNTWGETLSNAGESANFSSSNLLIMEVSPWVPPGTTFDCRFRVRFSNCDDCYIDSSRNDNDDFLDFEYSGASPFKIIHLQFTVID